MKKQRGTYRWSDLWHFAAYLIAIAFFIDNCVFVLQIICLVLEAVFWWMW